MHTQGVAFPTAPSAAAAALEGQALLAELEERATEGLTIAVELGDRMLMTYLAGELAIAATLRGDQRLTGCLWGAIESEEEEEEAAPIGQWPDERAEYEQLVVPQRPDHEFETGRAAGRAMSIAAAAGLEGR